MKHRNDNSMKVSVRSRIVPLHQSRRMATRYPRLQPPREDTRTSGSRKPVHQPVAVSHRINHEHHRACSCVHEYLPQESLKQQRHLHESSVDQSGRPLTKRLDTLHQPSHRKDELRTSVPPALGRPRGPSPDRRLSHELQVHRRQRAMRRQRYLRIGRQRSGRR